MAPVANHEYILQDGHINLWTHWCINSCFFLKVLTLCSTGKVFWCVEGTYCLQFQGQSDDLKIEGFVITINIWEELDCVKEEHYFRMSLTFFHCYRRKNPNFCLNNDQTWKVTLIYILTFGEKSYPPSS